MHTLAVTEQGMQLHVEAETLLLQSGRQVVRRVRLAEVGQVLLFGRVEISSGAIAALARRGVDVVFLTQQGYFRARLAGPASAQAALRLAQLQRALDPAFCAAVARALVAGKISHQRQLLLRAQRRLHDDALAEVLGQLRLLVEQVAAVPDLERLRGLEGRAAALYFGQFGKLLRVPELAFHGRTRRPPRDPVNACLSFAYTLLGTVLETELLRAGLDPLVGFFHQPQHGRPSLMLDLLEEFRPLADALVLRLLNRRQIGPLDFERRGGPALEEILAEAPGEEARAAASGGTTNNTNNTNQIKTPGEEPRAAASVGGGGAETAAATGETAPLAADGGAELEGVYLAGAGRRIFLTEFFRRLRERLYYPPRQGAFELRDILREQAYHLARVIDGRDPAYVPFVPA